MKAKSKRAKHPLLLRMDLLDESGNKFTFHYESPVKAIKKLNKLLSDKYNIKL